MRVTAVVLVALGSTSLLAAPAAAHPLVDRGYRMLEEEANFEVALAAFRDAEAADDLTLADLARLYEGRALVYVAMGNLDAAADDARRLASIAPAHRFNESTPPEVRTAFARATEELGQLEVTIRADPTRDGLHLRAHVERDAMSLVRRTRIHVRIGDGPWRTIDGDEHLVDAEPEVPIRYHAEVMGPGGATLARAGTEQAPLEAIVAPAETGRGEREIALLPVAGEGTDGDGGVSPWLWVSIGAAAIAAIVVIVLVLSQSSGGEAGFEVTRPIVQWDGP